MLTEREYELWCHRLKINERARPLIDKIRSSGPIRLVRSSGSNVIGRYPSRKMGRTLQFESHRCELAFIQQMEHDNDVLEMYDQPAKFNITYKTKKGRQANVPHCPDFLVLRREYVEFVECKTEEQLIKLAEEKPNRFQRDENGMWHSPPAEKYLKPYGIRYTILSTASINRIYIRNIEFLDDYMRADALLIDSKALQFILSLVKGNHGISLHEILAQILSADPPIAEADDVYSMIVRGDIYVDLRVEPLVERERVQVYENAESAPIIDRDNAFLSAPKAIYINLTEGTRLIWDSKVWEIANVGEANIWLQCESGGGTAITHEQFEKYVSQGVFKILESEDEKSPYAQALEILNNAPPSVRAEAERRYEVIKPYLSKEKALTGVDKERSIRRYIADFNEAKAFYDHGLIGLLPNWYVDGKSLKRMPDIVYEIMDERIKNDYETLVQKGMYAVWGKVRNVCLARGIPEEKCPSYQTFCDAVKDRPRRKQTKKRKGKRAANQHETFYYWLDKDIPPHGDFPFHIAHADHTKLDIELVCPITGINLGRPWASFLVDAFTRRLLAIVVTFDPPSYRSCMMLMRECARRFKRLPQILVVDGGREFDSIYFRRLAATFEITIKIRPAGKPKHGSVGERLFGIANKQFVHLLMGNTQIMTEIRKVTKSINPKKHAVWTLEAFTEWFTAWGYIFYDQKPHWTLKQSPLEAYARSVELTGKRLRRRITYDETFRILTMPAPRRRTAKNVVSKGVKINNIYYKCEEFRESQFENKRFHVRYDPFNLSIAYVYLRNRWVLCTSEHYITFQYLTERQLKFISRELRKRDQDLHRGRSLTASRLADFITAAERVQKSLAVKRLLLMRSKEREVMPQFRQINGGLALPIDISPTIQTALPPAAFQKEVAQKTSFFSSIDTDDVGLCKELK